MCVCVCVLARFLLFQGWNLEKKGCGLVGIWKEELEVAYIRPQVGLYVCLLLDCSTRVTFLYISPQIETGNYGTTAERIVNLPR